VLYLDRMEENGTGTLCFAIKIEGIFYSEGV
jgi:hypothetical protein